MKKEVSHAFYEFFENLPSKAFFRSISITISQLEGNPVAII